jgi:hypothetical protein
MPIVDAYNKTLTNPIDATVEAYDKTLTKH